MARQPGYAQPMRPARPPRAIALIACFLMTAAPWSQGCASMTSVLEDASVTWPEPIQSVRVDRRASELILRSDTESIKDNTDGFVSMREHIAQSLERVSGAGSQVVDLRFRFEISGTYSMWPMASCLVVLLYFGCPMATTEATATVTYQIDEQYYRASATGSAMVGLYYNLPGERREPAIWSMAAYRAIGNATKKALSAGPYAHLAEAFEAPQTSTWQRGGP